MAITERLTLEAFLALPEKKPALEYEDGRVTQKVSPKGKHGVLQFTVAACVNQFAVPRRLAMAIPELRSTYDDYSRVPDVSVYLWDRIPVDEAGEIANDFYHPPDIAIEITSPGQRINAQVRRCDWFVAHGVRAALLLDPADKSVRVIRPVHPVAVLHGFDPIDLQDILPGFELSVNALFDPLKIF